MLKVSASNPPPDGNTKNVVGNAKLHLMKKHFILVTILLLLSTTESLCQSKVFNSKNDYDTFWIRAINFIVQKKIDVNLTDKTTGIIILKNVVLTYSTEDKKSEFFNPKADIFVNEVKNQGKRFPEPAAGYGPYQTNKETYENPVYATCILKIKPLGNSCEISIELDDLYYFKSLYTSSNTDKRNRNTLITYKSTGNFEQQVFDGIDNLLP